MCNGQNYLKHTTISYKLICPQALLKLSGGKKKLTEKGYERKKTKTVAE